MNLILITKTIGTAIIKTAAIPLVFILSSAGYQLTPIEQNLGVFQPSGGGTYRLSNNISTTQTSIKLSSFKEPGSDIPYTMTVLNSAVGYGTLEPTLPSRSEFISFTGITQNTDGTASLTGVVRGLPRSNTSAGCTASTTLQRTHTGQSIFILSDNPCFFNEYAIKRNDETVSGAWTTTAQWTFPNPTAAFSPATRQYVDAAAFGGIGGATETATGTVEIATQTEASIGATNGTLGRLAIPASIATSTWVSATAGNRILVTQSTGFLDPNFLQASSTKQMQFATSTYIGAFPAFGGIGKNFVAFTTVGTTTFSVPTGVTRLSVWACGGGGGGGSTPASAGDGAGGGGAGGCAFKNVNVGASATTSVVVYVGWGGVGGTAATDNASTGGDSKFSSFLTGNGGVKAAIGISAGYSTGGAGGNPTSGDLNIPGQYGANGLSTVAGQGGGGDGGNSYFGYGGRGFPPGTDSGSNSAGVSGTGCAAGGSGGYSNTGTAQIGGNGTAGCIFITW